MKAVNIKWDTDGNMEVFESLPTEIEIPEDIIKDIEDINDYNDEIGDYISDVTGFCHYGFELIDNKIKEKQVKGNGESIPNHVRFLLDEFANIGELPPEYIEPEME